MDDEDSIDTHITHQSFMYSVHTPLGDQSCNYQVILDDIINKMLASESVKFDSFAPDDVESTLYYNI